MASSLSLLVPPSLKMSFRRPWGDPQKQSPLSECFGPLHSKGVGPHLVMTPGCSQCCFSLFCDGERWIKILGVPFLISEAYFTLILTTLPLEYQYIWRARSIQTY